jgi:hypothetical protein
MLKIIFIVGVGLLLLSLIAGCVSHSTTLVSGTGEIIIHVNGIDNSALQGAKVVSDKQPNGQVKLTGLTDTDGTVLFQNVKQGEYEFYISRFDYYQTQVLFTVNEGQTTNIPIKMTTSIPPVTTSPTDAQVVTFAQLTSEPEKYDKQTITIKGFWFDGFEIVVLAERLEPSSFAPGNIQPAGTKIWVKNGLPEEVRKELFTQPNNPTGYPAHTVKWN